MRSLFLASGAVGLVVAVHAPAQAQLNAVDLYRNLANTQSGPTTVTANGAFFNADATTTNPGDFDSVALSVPGSATPYPLDMVTTSRFSIGPSFATKAAMDAAFPNGLYIFNASNSGTAATGSAQVMLTGDAYTADTPALSAASYTALQGLSTSAGPLTLTFAAFTPNPATNAAFTFFSIFGTSQDCQFLAPTSTSCTVDPSALTPGTSYTWELDYTNRIEGTDPNGVFTGLGFDVRTDGSFTTAASIPEPSSLALAGVALAGLAGLRRRT